MLCDARDNNDFVMPFLTSFLAHYRILELCKTDSKGIPDSVIKKQLPHIDAQQRVTAINRLLSTVSIGRGVQSVLLYFLWIICEVVFFVFLGFFANR